MNDEFDRAELIEALQGVPKGIPLIVALNGFSDAGNVIAQLRSYFLGFEQKKILDFNVDQYLDYRSRRPTITFKNDHLEKYDPQTLSLNLMTDSLGAPFLLLEGFEPDFKWNRFVKTVEQIVKRQEISITAWVHAIPMPVPHTRPIGATVSGSRKDLIDKHSAWRPITKLAASIGHVLEFTLHEANQEVAGFVLLVPHYLANNDYPGAFLKAIHTLMDATGLLFKTDDVLQEEEAFMKQVNEQIAENEESMNMVQTLELRYDEYVKNFRIDLENNISENLPTGDELAMDFEKFLAGEWRGDNNEPESEE